jgi:response regulator RpfG family c-di-GMP phosphodiesterase
LLDFGSEAEHSSAGSFPSSHEIFIVQQHRDYSLHMICYECILIEDDKLIAGLAERGLKQDSHRVPVSHNGTDGTEMMLEREYDAALLDIFLPGMDGFAGGTDQRS